MTRLITFSLLLWGAEVTASWWVWSGAPMDTLRDWCPDFWRWESGRLHYWIPVFALSVLLSVVSWYGLHRRVRGIAMAVLGAGLAVGVEVSTSILYWRSASSLYVRRDLYESFWDWHLIPYLLYIGGKTFKGYLWDHLALWAVFLCLGLTVWYFWDRWERSHTRTTA